MEAEEERLNWPSRMEIELGYGMRGGGKQAAKAVRRNIQIGGN
jgi:hypothetical protein